MSGINPFFYVRECGDCIHCKRKYNENGLLKMECEERDTRIWTNMAEECKSYRKFI